MKPLCFIFIAALLLATETFYSQTSPWVDTPTVNPQVIMATGQTTIFTKVTTSSYGNKISTSNSVNHNTKEINLEGCYSQSMLAALRTYIDTFNINSLQPGVYSIKFAAYESSSTQSCQPVYSNSVSTTVTVTGIATGLKENEGWQSIEVFPNPVQKTLYLGRNFSTVLITSLNGDLVKKEESGYLNSVDVSDLKSGFYFVQLISGNELINTRFVKME